MFRKWLYFFLTTLLFTAVAKAQQASQGGILRVPILHVGFVENFNPYTTRDIFHGVLYEPLFIFNNMTGETHYRLAESVSYSEDLQTISLTLKEDLLWSDGLPLTAEDVEFSFKLVRRFQTFDIKGIWDTGNLKNVRAIDERTVEFMLKQPDSTFVWNMTAYHIVPKHAWKNIDSIQSFTNINPVGSGPMTELEHIEPTKMALCRNPFYYLADSPKLDCIQYHAFADNSQIQVALVNGELDWGSNFITDVELTFVGADSKHHHFWYPANDAIHLYLNAKKQPLNELSVRQALSMSINRKELIELAVYGYPIANHNAGGIGEYYQPFLDSNLQQHYAKLTQYNARQAQVLLNRAGIVDRNGDGFRDNKDGSEIVLNIEVVEGWSDWIRVARMLESYFYDIGIRLNTVISDWYTYTENLREGRYDISISWSLVSPHPILAFQEYYHSSRIGKGFHVNHGFHSNEIDDLIDSFSLTTDENTQHEIVSKLQEITAEKLPFIPLFSNPTWFQYNSKNIVGWPNAKDPYVQPVWYNGGNRLLILNNLYVR